MSIIESVRNFIKTCPHLVEYCGAVRVNVDYLSNSPTTYSIEGVPVEPILKKYVNGTVRQYVFIFCSRESYGEDVRTNIDNSGFYENFSNWLEKCTLDCNLPILDKGMEPWSIEAITSGYAFDTDADNAKYQIQVKLKYFKRGEIQA